MTRKKVAHDFTDATNVDSDVPSSYSHRYTSHLHHASVVMGLDAPVSRSAKHGGAYPHWEAPHELRGRLQEVAWVHFCDLIRTRVGGACRAHRQEADDTRNARQHAG